MTNERRIVPRRVTLPSKVPDLTEDLTACIAAMDDDRTRSSKRQPLLRKIILGYGALLTGYIIWAIAPSLWTSLVMGMVVVCLIQPIEVVVLKAYRGLRGHQSQTTPHHLFARAHGGEIRRLDETRKDLAIRLAAADQGTELDQNQTVHLLADLAASIKEMQGAYNQSVSDHVKSGRGHHIRHQL